MTRYVKTPQAALTRIGKLLHEGIGCVRYSFTDHEDRVVCQMDGWGLADPKSWEQAQRDLTDLSMTENHRYFKRSEVTDGMGFVVMTWDVANRPYLEITFYKETVPNDRY